MTDPRETGIVFNTGDTGPNSEATAAEAAPAEPTTRPGTKRPKPKADRYQPFTW